MLLSLEQINKGFGNRDDASFRSVLNDLSLEVGEVGWVQAERRVRLVRCD